MELDSVQPRHSSGGALNRAHREFFGRLKSWSRWEFRPPYLFYPPVVAYIAYLGNRFRSWTLFTAANPAIPAGGFVGESKYQILDHLRNELSGCRFPGFSHVECPPNGLLKLRSSCGGKASSFRWC